MGVSIVRFDAPACTRSNRTPNDASAREAHLFVVGWEWREAMSELPVVNIDCLLPDSQRSDAMEFFENEVDFDQLQLDMQELQKLLDDSAAKISDPDAKVIVEQLSAMFRTGPEDFTREYPAMTANIESEISALQEKLASCAAQTPASSAAPQAASFPGLLPSAKRHC